MNTNICVIVLFLIFGLWKCYINIFDGDITLVVHAFYPVHLQLPFTIFVFVLNVNDSLRTNVAVIYRMKLMNIMP